MSEKSRADHRAPNLRDILDRLRSRYRVSLEEFVAPRAIAEGAKAFEILVGIVLSQNTSDRNAIKAFEELRKVLGGSIDPQKVLSTPIEVIENAIKCAGQQRRRARILVELAKHFLENPNLVEELRRLSAEEARAKLMELPGIGPKTADVFVLMYLRKPTFPIDTHIRRVAERMGIGRDYEVIRKRFLEMWRTSGLDLEDLIELHLLLIQHGRETCRARNPLCRECVLRDFCASSSP